MKPTSWKLLAGLVTGCALFGWLITWRWYGDFGPVSKVASLTMWCGTALCIVLGRIVKKALADNMIGFDRRQLSPVTAANYYIIGKASALVGAVTGGFYLGFFLEVLRGLARLAAAQADLWPTVFCVVSSFAWLFSGVWLERQCQVPPTSSGQGSSMPA